MDINKEREAFENHLKKMGKTDNETFSKNEDDSYQMDIIHFGWKIWQAAKAQAVPEGFVLVSAEQLSQWGHMANCAQEYGCPECYESRGYAHSLACEINAYFNVGEAQEPAND